MSNPEQYHISWQPPGAGTVGHFCDEGISSSFPSGFTHTGVLPTACELGVKLRFEQIEETAPNTPALLRSKH